MRLHFSRQIANKVANFANLTSLVRHSIDVSLSLFLPPYDVEALKYAFSKGLRYMFDSYGPQKVNLRGQHCDRAGMLPRRADRQIS